MSGNVGALNTVMLGTFRWFDEAERMDVVREGQVMHCNAKVRVIF